MSQDQILIPSSSSINLDCRFYHRKFPKINELVMVEVRQIDHIGASVKLLEYNNIEGLIMLGELSKKRIKSIIKLTRVGRQEVAVVTRVDENKGYLDLSKRQLSPENIVECETKYNKGKTVNNILKHVAQTTKTDIKLLYKNIGWPLYNKYGHALDAFKIAVYNPETVLEGLSFNIEIREELLKVINSRLAPQPMKIRSDFIMTCFEYEGIDAIKNALMEGMKANCDMVKTEIRVVAPPVYTIIVTTKDKNAGMDAAELGLKRIADEIKCKGGSFVIKEKCYVVGEQVGAFDDFSKRGLEDDEEDLEEEYDETMGEVDIGIDVAEIDKRDEVE